MTLFEDVMYKNLPEILYLQCLYFFYLLCLPFPVSVFFSQSLHIFIYLYVCVWYVTFFLKHFQNELEISRTFTPKYFSVLSLRTRIFPCISTYITVSKSEKQHKILYSKYFIHFQISTICQKSNFYLFIFRWNSSTFICQDSSFNTFQTTDILKYIKNC